MSKQRDCLKRMATIQRRVMRELADHLGDAALPATLKVLEVIAALERLDNEIVEEK